MIRSFLIALIVGVFSGCQTVSNKDTFGSRTTRLGETVQDSFDVMIAHARPSERILGCVYFGFNQVELTEAKKVQLDSIARELSLRVGPVLVEGHADYRREERFNKRLGYERALAVAEYLKNAGVWDERIVIHSFGENRPAASNWSERDRGLNRRVEIKMFAQGEGMLGEEAVRVFGSMIKDKVEAEAQPQFGIPLLGELLTDTQ